MKALVCVLIVVALLLSGCAHQQVYELQSWLEQTKPLVESGSMKRSDYYAEAYRRAVALPNIQGKAFILRQFSAQRDAAIAYESGQITEERYAAFNEEILARATEFAEQEQAQRAAAASRALTNYGNYMQQRSLNAQTWEGRQSIHCTSNSFGGTVSTDCR